MISPSSFAVVFSGFLRGVEAYKNSPGPFVDFQSGLAASKEGFKEWLYFEGRRRLDVPSWKESWIGSGKILERAISSIVIHYDDDYRNSTVEWDGRYGGDKSASHQKMVAAAKSASLRTSSERALFKMYVEQDDPEVCFAELTQQFGRRYDLIAYLFFLRDWQIYLPLRPKTFSTAFDMLGVPLAMKGRCSWENYSEFLARMREVQKHLQSYDIPGGVRLLDAHSFCWMLVDPQIKQTQTNVALIEEFSPVPSQVQSRPIDGPGDDDYDPEQRQYEQRWIGDLAQAVVLRAEKERLTKVGKNDLARQVEDVSRQYHLGYDIRSFHEDGTPKPIEVKAAGRLGKDLRFYLSENERVKSRELPGYTFALVLEVTGPSPRILEFAGARLSASALHPVSYVVRLEAPRKRARG